MFQMAALASGVASLQIALQQAQQVLDHQAKKLQQALKD